MSMSVEAFEDRLLLRVVSWWDTLGRKPNDPVGGLGVPLSAKPLLSLAWGSPLGSARYPQQNQQFVSAARRLSSGQKRTNKI